MLKTRAGYMYNGAEMAEISLSLYFPDNRCVAGDE